MVRTSGGIRISAGKSSKKGGGAGNRSAPSTPSGKTGSSSRGNARLPPIPHCEAPSWQKPITNFFNAGASSSKNEQEILEQPEENLIDTNTETECTYNETESNEIGDKSDTEVTNSPDNTKKEKIVTEKTIEHLNNMNDDEPQIKRKKEEQGKENEDNNIDK